MMAAEEEVHHTLGHPHLQLIIHHHPISQVSTIIYQMLALKLEYMRVMVMPESLSFLQINYLIFQAYRIPLVSHLSRREEKQMDDIDESQNIS